MKKIYMSAVLFGLAMTACTNQDEVMVEEPQGIETISAEIIQPAGMSRVIVGDLKEGAYSMKWRADDPTTKAVESDVIYVYDSEGNAGRFVYSEPADAPQGIFKRDTKVGSPIKDIKNALCVTTSVGRPKDLPASIEANFNYMSTMMYTCGAENAPMYGEMKDGVLQFHMVTGMLELNIPNLNEYRSKVDDMLAIRLTAYEYDAKNQLQAKKISSPIAKIDFTDKKNPVLSLNGGDNYIGLFLQANTVVDNKVYVPLITGDYAKLEIEIWPRTSFKNPTDRLSETVTLVAKGGTGSFTIEKKMYTFTRSFKKKADATIDGTEPGKGDIFAPSMPGGDNDFNVK